MLSRVIGWLCERQIWDSQTLSLVHVIRDLQQWVRALALNFSRVSYDYHPHANQ